jgi:hypothetical protein
MAAFNYFNYFTEIEEYFWRKRGAQLLVSPLDWAILESWQKAGIPLEAVLKGIDRAFESYARSRRGGAGRPLKSLAYCVDAVMDAAEEAQEAAVGGAPRAGAPQSAEPFSREELRSYLARVAERCGHAVSKLPKAGAELAQRIGETRLRLNELTAVVETPGVLDLEDLERRLTVLEDRLYATLSAAADEEIALKIRREMDRALSAYRRKMTAEQIAMLEQQYFRRRLFEEYQLPRLSLFYFA